MTEQEQPQSIAQRVINAVLKRIEGGDDPRKKYDYLSKPDKDTIKTLSILTDQQVDSVAECVFLGRTFPSLMPLTDISLELAHWSPSKKGVGREQLTQTMISQETNIIPTVLNQPSGQNQKDKEQKQKKAEEAKT